MGKKNKQPKIDIIIPNYNKGMYLSASINSVINQTYKNWKLYIIDDNSHDDSKRILKRYKKKAKINIFFLKNNKGPGFCRNLGISKSKSQYVAFLDSDDYWPKNKLNSQIKYMLKNNLDFTYTDYISFFQNKRGIRKLGKSNVPSNFTFSSFIKNTSINTSTLLLSQKLIKNIRFKDLKRHEDYIFKCEILKNNKNLIAKKFNKSHAYYRILEKSRSQNKLKSIFYLWKYNKKFNKLNFLDNVFSIIFISFHSLRKYGLTKGV